jgi:nitroreductase
MGFSEPLDAAWRLRYGAGPPAGAPEAVAPFLRHRSVRRYSGREVPESLMAALIAAAQSAATSSNLQLWTAISVQEPVARERLARLCADQEQVRRAPWFLAFVADHYRLRKAARSAGGSAAGLDYEEFFVMAVIDASLAAERLVCAAEACGLGICYIGAMRNDPAGVREALGLPPGCFAVFGLCVGWPEEGAVESIKPRLPQSAVWHRERYDREVSVAEYDERMRGFYESQRMKGEVTWSMRSARRVDGAHMTGRERIQPFLREQGFGRR